ncbi:MAG: hypothetical protein PVH05_14205 [Burkholderiales bacterium]|jgi:hypothetical protein
MKDRLSSLIALLAPKAVYGGWFLRHRPVEAIKIVLAHALAVAVALYLGFLFFRILWLIGAAVASLVFDIPFEFPSTIVDANS